MRQVQIETSWREVLEDEFEKDYFKKLRQFVREEYQHHIIYPPTRNIFSAMNLCPLHSTKVVIIGQDPYHGKNQAIGLSFAVAPNVALPPSLQNIFKEIRQDLKIDPYSNGDLSRWAKQGVLLLNAVLTVRAGQPASHKNQGWEIFTDAVIKALTTHQQSLVYLLWGKYAQQKGEIINRERNLVLQSGHPSPYSAHLFHGHHHFSQANTYLALQGKSPIDWR